ncbi:hypothetical protein FGO68_gene7699 [Halteria grandinella]|uniref:Uncharacterized protein n=1 Tax=Halteria grandinella TaxID=5974 RepID=A0A8J8P0Z9_HALGN|nr:hypothetical protein FGO68_gene7699 [Halteria grandinella]
MEEMYEQVSTVERERARLREAVMRYEEENRIQATSLEEKNIEITELRKHIEIQEEKLNQQSHVREEKINNHMTTIQELHNELDMRSKRIKELQREKESLEKNLREEVQQLRDELELSKEKIQLQQKELARLEPYKKRSEEMAQIKADLRDCETQNLRLKEDVSLLQKEKANVKELKTAIEYLEEQLAQAKSKAEGFQQQALRLDKKLGEAQEAKNDLLQKNSILEEKVNKHKAKLRQLESSKQPNSTSWEGSGALQYDEVLDKLRKLSKENELLKVELENKFDAEKLKMKNDLEDAIREKQMLQESHQSAQDQIARLQSNLQALSNNMNDEEQSSETQAKLLQDLQSEISTIVREKDDYFMRLTRTEITLSQLTKQHSDLQTQFEVNEAKVKELMLDNQRAMQTISDIQGLLMKEKEGKLSIQGEVAKLEAQLTIAQKENSNLQSEIERLRESERAARDELLVFKANSESNSSNQTQEMIAQFMKKTDELQLSSQLSDLKLEIREKDLKLKEQDRDFRLKEKELSLLLERTQEEVTLKSKELQYKQLQWEKERKTLSEQGSVSKKLLQNLQKEQRLMSAAFHKVGLELYKERHFSSSVQSNQE